MPEIKMWPVKSPNVAAIGYDPESKTLRVQFNAGSLYEAEGVPQDVYDALASTNSKGSYYAKFIRGQYPIKKVG